MQTQGALFAEMIYLTAGFLSWGATGKFCLQQGAFCMKFASVDYALRSRRYYNIAFNKHQNEQESRSDREGVFKRNIAWVSPAGRKCICTELLRVRRAPERCPFLHNYGALAVGQKPCRLRLALLIEVDGTILDVSIAVNGGV